MMEQMINKITNDELLPSSPTCHKPMLSEAVFRPMIFSTTMVRALLDGTKTQTRRLVKHKDFDVLQFEYTYKEWFCKFYATTHEGSDLHISVDIFPQVLEKQFIWVRETFNLSRLGTFEYKASISKFAQSINKEFGIKWKPSLFMPKLACRTWLEVSNVRLERLHDITEQDAIKEGAICEWVELTTMTFTAMDYLSGKMKFDFSAKDSYKSLWIKINGQKSWDENPLVWVYDFKVSLDCPHGFR